MVTIGMPVGMPVVQSVSVTIVLPLAMAIMLPRALMARRSIPLLVHRALMAGNQDWRRGLSAFMARRSVFRLRRHGLVMGDPLQVHPKFLHFGKTLGRDEISALPFDLLLLHPTHFFGGFNEYAAQGKGVDRANAIFVWLFGFHVAPFRRCGKNRRPWQSDLRLFLNAALISRRKLPAESAFGLGPAFRLEIVFYSRPGREARWNINAS